MATTKVQAMEDEEEQETVQLLLLTSSTTKSSAASTKTPFYTLLLGFLLLTAAGLLYAQVATGDLNDEARTETIKTYASIMLKSNRSRTDTPAALTVTAKPSPTYPPTDAPISLPTQLLRTQPPTTHTSEATKQQRQDQLGDEPRIEVYSKLRDDRAGSAIQDMLYAHAYAFANGMQYMGACPTKCPRHCKHQKADQKLLDGIGLNSTLPIACPPGNASNQVLLEGRQYRKDSYLSNEQWLKDIRSAVRCTKPDSEDGDNVMQVAVHIRRGDVTPCPWKNVPRYTPNSQYMDVLDQYLPHDDNSDTLRKVRVSIFSERISHESFDVFAKKNYSLFLNTPLVDVWRAIVTADVVIMAKSSFSFAPTLLNGNATVWYTPFWHSPLPGWQNVSEEILEKSSGDLQEIQEKMHCGS
jgi:hypothetical protein